MLVLVDRAKEEVSRTMRLEKPADVKGSFILYNVLAFWMGVLESLIFAVFGGSLLSLVWNGALSFCVAYTLYFTMTCTQIKPYMFYSLCFIALYILFNVYMGVSTLLYVVPAVRLAAPWTCDLPCNRRALSPRLDSRRLMATWPDSRLPRPSTLPRRCATS